MDMMTIGKQRKFHCLYPFGITLVTVICLFGIGYSSWTFINQSSRVETELTGGVDYVDGALRFLNPDETYKDSKGNVGVEPLQYNSRGFVYDDEIGSIGHLRFHFVFDSSAFYQAYQTNNQDLRVSFGYSLGYDAMDTTGFVLIRDCLSQVTFSETTNGIENQVIDSSLDSSKLIIQASSSEFMITNQNKDSDLFICVDFQFDASKTSGGFDALKKAEFDGDPSQSDYGACYALTCSMDGDYL